MVWVAAALTFATLAMLTGFFSFGAQIPMTSDMNPGLYGQLPYQFPPQAWFNNNYWLGQMQMPQDLQPMSLLAHLPLWMFFSGYYPLCAALSLVAFYGFLRELGFRRGVSILGGILYAWQGDLFSNLLAGHFSSATVWLMFALAAFFALRSARRRNWLDAALSGVCTGMMVSLLPDRGGLCSLIIGGLFLVAVWRKRHERTEAARHVGRLLLVMIVAVAVALPGVYATLSWTTIKAKPTGVETPQQKYEWATQWSYTPEEIFNYMIPGFYGWRNGSTNGPYWGRIGQSPESRNFCLAIFTIGTAGFLLAVIGMGVSLKRSKAAGSLTWLSEEQASYARFALVAVILGWLFALGKYGPLYEWFYRLPYMDTWRNPLKFLAPVSLALILLAACGAQALTRLIEAGAEADKGKKRIRSVLFNLLIIIGVFWLLSFPGRLPMTVWLENLQYSPQEVDAILATLRGSLFFAGLVVALLWLGWRILMRDEAGRRQEFINPLIQKTWDAMMLPANIGRTWLVLLASVTMMQMLWVQSHYSDLIDFKAFYGKNALITRLQSKEEVSRISIEMSDPLLRQALTTLFPYNGIQSLDIPAASRIPDDYAQFFTALQTKRARLQQLAGVKYWLSSAASLPTIQDAPEFRGAIKAVNYYTIDPYFSAGAPTHAIVQLNNYLPKVSLLTKVEDFPDDEALLKRLADDQWNPFASVLVRQEDLAAVLAQAGAKGDAGTAKLKPEAKLVLYSDQRVEIAVQSPVPATLLIDDRYDAGWKATLNGKLAKLFPADFILSGLSVPAGTSKVVLTYEVPLTPYYVQLIVLALIAGWAMGAAVLARINRKTA